MRQIGILVCVSIALCAGCVTVPPQGLPTAPLGQALPGSYHRVERGETLWRIARNYHVDLDAVVAANRINDATSLEVGQLVFIPHERQEELSSGPRISSASEDFIWPLKGRVIATFGQTTDSMVNKGIHVQPVGTDEVVASRGGRVVFSAEDLPGFGRTLIIDHGDGFSTVYARCAEVWVNPGAVVAQGTRIGRVGSGGRQKTVYLHFEIRKRHLAQNPYFYLP